MDDVTGCWSLDLVGLSVQPTSKLPTTLAVEPAFWLTKNAHTRYLLGSQATAHRGDTDPIWQEDRYLFTFGLVC